MPRTPVKTPPRTPTRTPTRRSARIHQRKSMELASVTPAEMALRILQLESNYEDLVNQMSNLSGDIESKLPEVTVALLTDGVEDTRDEINEIRNEMAELRAAKDDIRLGRRREMEYIARIDQLKSEKHTLREATSKLRTTNHRLESEKEASLEQMKLLKDQIETEAKEKAEITVRYRNLCGQYNKAVDLMEPIFKKMTPQKKVTEEE